MSRIILVSELFYPDGTSTAHILTKIADTLYKDHDIIVLAGSETYSLDNIQGIGGKKPYPIKRIAVKDYDKNRLPSRVLKLFVTSFKLGRLLWNIARKGDEVLIVTNPAPFLILASLIKKIRRFKLHIIVHDIFPENLIPAGVLKSQRNILYRVTKHLFSRVYRSADTIIVLGRDMKMVFDAKFKKFKKKPSIIIIENWADPLPQNISAQNKTDDKVIKILYAGNIGRCQGLDKLIKIFETTSNPNVKLEIRGSGAMFGELKELIDYSNSNILLGGNYPREAQFDILSDCDIGLVSLTDGMFGLGVPSKAYNIMAAGKPILFVGDPASEIAMTVSENNLGFVFDIRDEAGLSDWLSKLSEKDKVELESMGRNAQKVATLKYSQSIILSKYSHIFSNK